MALVADRLVVELQAIGEGDRVGRQRVDERARDRETDSKHTNGVFLPITAHTEKASLLIFGTGGGALPEDRIPFCGAAGWWGGGEDVRGGGRETRGGGRGGESGQLEGEKPILFSCVLDLPGGASRQARLARHDHCGGSHAVRRFQKLTVARLQVNLRLRERS